MKVTHYDIMRGRDDDFIYIACGVEDQMLDSDYWDFHDLMNRIFAPHGVEFIEEMESLFLVDGTTDVNLVKELVEKQGFIRNIWCPESIGIDWISI